MTIFHQDRGLTIHAGDCREVLPTLPDRSVHCVVTSPPYWSLRADGLATAFSGYDDGSSAPSFTTIGWEPSCAHVAAQVPATVLDPFGGTGTTAMVAQQLGRRAILIDLNPEYHDQALARASREWGIGGPRLTDRPSDAPEGSWLAALEETAP